MKGSVRKRGNTWSYRVDFGKSADGKRNQIEKGGYKTKKEADKALNDVLFQYNNTLMHIDSIFGLEMKMENGEIYIRFPQDCKTIRYYIEQLYHLKEMVDSEQIEYSTYQYLKATFGKKYE